LEIAYGKDPVQLSSIQEVIGGTYSEPTGTISRETEVG
jgi:hypothetical protein